MRTRFLALAGLALLVSFGQSTQSVTILRAARMFDGKEMRTPGLVVVSGDRILGVGPNAAIPAGARTIDFGDATLSPGFIDAHTHLSYMFHDDSRQNAVDNLQRTVPEVTLMATENLRKTLMAGITTARDVGSRNFIDVGLRNASAAHLIPGPRMFVAVHSLGSTGGHCDRQIGRASCRERV